ncbi:TPA: hypothetical protein NJ565_004597 [Vibrio parahaemolyticus]|nr:hypothetical protein [Vibrio parahaemolyticus]HCG9751035.1 hypothetical protein [Vibrio parahaemolyticus]
MRKLSCEERKYIHRILHSPSIKEEGAILFNKLLEDLFVNENNNVRMAFSTDKNWVGFSVDGDKPEFQSKLINLIVFINLIRELNENGYLIVVESAAKGDFSNGAPYRHSANLSLSLSTFLLSNFNSLLVVTDKLRELHENNYKSIEEVRHSQAMDLAFIAIMVSILIAIFA